MQRVSTTHSMVLPRAMANRKSHRRESTDKTSREATSSKDRRTLSPTRQLSWRKKLLFATVTTLGMFCLTELLLWAVGVKPAYYQTDPYAGFATHIPHFVPVVDERGGKWMTVAPSKARVLNPQRFRAKKRAGTYRIVCVGGSTTYGRPFFDQTSWPGWIRALLPAADDRREWEVINVGAISYASYRTASLMEELAQYEPDLFIVYTGHNEFLERRTYRTLAERSSTMTDILALASHTRTLTLVQKGIGLAGVRRQAPPAPSAQLGTEVKAISINAVGREAYHRDPQLAEDVDKHFRATLQVMCQIADRAGAEIVFVVPASNLLDFAPFKSEHRSGLNAEQLAEWQRHFQEVLDLDVMGRHELALAEVAKAEQMDDQYAALSYLKGKILLELGRYEQAAQAFRLARDEDVCPLRAITPLVDTVRDVAREQTQDLVDFEQIVRAHSAHGLPGRDMFHDHVHPTIEANRLLGVAIVECLQQRGIVHQDDSWNEQAVARVADAVDAQIDRARCATQLRSLAGLLASLGQPDQAQYQAELSLELSGRTAAVLEELANGLRSQRAFDVAADYYQELVKLDPDRAESHLGLGICWLEIGREGEGAAELRTALKCDPDLAIAHSRLGVWLALHGELAEAEKHFTEAVRLLPDKTESHSNLGLVLARQGRYREAIRHYQRALAIDPRSSSAHYNMGLALEELGQRAKAVTHYEAVLRSDPNHQDARVRLRRGP